MSTAGPNLPGTAADDATVGTVSWTNPNNAKTNDGSGATASLLSQTSHYLKLTNFGFAIAGGSTVNGVQVDFRRKQNIVDGNIADNSVKLVKGGAISGSDKAGAVGWTTSFRTDTYGGSSDTWGLGLTDVDVNASTFGVVISAIENTGGTSVASIDYAQITITYSPGPTLGADLAPQTAPVPCYRQQTAVVAY